MSFERRQGAHAAVFGATAALLQARERKSPPAPGVMPARLRPPPIDSLPALLDPDNDQDDAQTRLARISSAALLSTVRGVDKDKIKRLLNAREKARLDDAYTTLASRTATSTPHCRHCTVFQHLAYDGDAKHVPVAPIEGDHHDARIVTSFDPDTCISTAEIKRHEFFVKGAHLANRVIAQAHPLNWEANSLWDAAGAVERKGTNWVSLGPIESTDQWKEQDGYRFLFESVTWPQNEYLTARVENILRISVDPSQSPDQLSFEYALEKCCSSNFGITWENGGMDVDFGYYRGSFSPLSRVAPLASAGMSRSDAQARALIKTGKTLEKNWGEEPHLVTISAAKSLRFTMPKNGPAEEWALLNWTAPVFLFNFLNLSVCQIVHLLSANQRVDDQPPIIPPDGSRLSRKSRATGARA